MPPPLVLASTSAYKRALLARLTIPFECVDPTVDETPAAGEEPAEIARRLADEKALAGARARPASLVIGADQVAALDGKIFAKPGTVARAREQLQASSGRRLRFYTAVALAMDRAVLQRRTVETEVEFRQLTVDAIEGYLEREPALDCAGSFRWEGLGIALFTALRGEDPTALEGLPLIALTSMLGESGISPLLSFS